MDFIAYCPTCKKMVSVLVMLAPEDLKPPIDINKEIRVMHTADVDHIWSLSQREKENLRTLVRS